MLFLGLTVFVELMGFYPSLIDKYNVFEFLSGHRISQELLVI